MNALPMPFANGNNIFDPNYTSQPTFMGQPLYDN